MCRRLRMFSQIKTNRAHLRTSRLIIHKPTTGGRTPPVQPHASVAGMLHVIDNMGTATDGQLFVDYSGKPMPWWAARCSAMEYNGVSTQSVTVLLLNELCTEYIDAVNYTTIMYV